MSPDAEIDIYLTKYLSSEGKFAYAVLIRNVLHELFYSDFKEFCIKTMRIVLFHLSLPDEVSQNIQQMLLETEIAINSLEMASVLTRESVLKDQKQILIQDLICLALMDGEYDARWRVLVKRVSQLLGISARLEEAESSVANFILRGSQKQTEEDKRIMRRKELTKKVKRYGLIAAVAVGGGAIIGLSGGLAAPVIVEGLTVLAGTSALGSAAVVALNTTAGTAFVASLFGTAGASFAGYKMVKRYGDIKDFEFGQLFEGGSTCKNMIPLIESPHLSCTIAISGWIQDHEENNFSYSWRRLNLSKEQYFLRYESSNLYEVGKAMEQSITDSLSSIMASFKFTFLSTVIKGITLPAVLLSFASVIDLPWSVGCTKAALAGKQLAQILLTREHGRRPVSLIGYSLGARVIYYCLLEMLESGAAEGILEDVYLIGAPCPADPDKWICFTSLVSGTITNAFSVNDNVLKFLYRTLSLPDGGVAGLKSIGISHRRLRNVNISGMITGHGEYPLKLNSILRELNIPLIKDNSTALLQPSCSKS